MPASDTASPRAGYTLPVFACAGALAALHHLRDTDHRPRAITLDLLNPPLPATIAIDQLAPLPDGSVLAITHSDPGDNLDLTRNTPLWSVVTWGRVGQPERILLQGGEGIGRQLNRDQAPAIYQYARELIHHHLTPLIPEGKTLCVTIVLPEGRALADRTSNAAFGVVEGLSLLGTSGISAPLSAPGQLDQSREILRAKADQYAHLVFCLGENGLDLACQLGIDPDRRVKTANWLGPMLVEAGQVSLAGVLLLGYHGKLIKLAGGIFHTHHHVADGRQEILAACCAAEGVALPIIQEILKAATVEAGLQSLRDHDAQTAQRVYRHIVARIDDRASAYVHAHTGNPLTVGTMVFDRQRQVIATSDRARLLFEQVLVD
ncbi:cobalt-precorrin-5B (C(1))-methyltransferase [Nodosilinea sp. LEGE 07088]|uniref:cobalt-precorrin-5B (C(1))-methyltransferase CbiD n=1 Tax=Nodosilinea sp. LEGE 07088 TaxID=2777968 RepID=UPI00187E710F|nr:cobalt-precorrin-5B (C(1))-methyltransferase CbiD [Nodosilinea sp. LEGE 07088]MBE9139917.1 cobalt-precorrin-5B (C(1))-methyltransferase [Nodosilinea sp. LEGE 07088]